MAAKIDAEDARQFGFNPENLVGAFAGSFAPAAFPPVVFFLPTFIFISAF
jgi:hypothetical protein